MGDTICIFPNSFAEKMCHDTNKYQLGTLQRKGWGLPRAVVAPASPLTVPAQGQREALWTGALRAS